MRRERGRTLQGVRRQGGEEEERRRGLLVDSCTTKSTEHEEQGVTWNFSTLECSASVAVTPGSVLLMLTLNGDSQMLLGRHRCESPMRVYPLVFLLSFRGSMRPARKVVSVRVSLSMRRSWQNGSMSRSPRLMTAAT